MRPPFGPCVLVGAGGVLLACGFAGAQCTPAWHTAGTEISGTVTGLLAWDDGTGAALYAGGFRALPGVDAGFVRRFEGGGWALIGPEPSHLLIQEMAGSDWGGTPRLFVAGRYDILGQYPIALQWDGATWSGIGPAQFGSSVVDPWVTDMAVAHVSGQPSLFVSKTYSSGGIFSTGTVYRWDGSMLIKIFEVFGGKSNMVAVRALALGWEPAEPGVFIGGYFASAAAPGFRSLVRWNGGLFQVGGVGYGHAAIGISHMETLDLGRSPALYISGAISQIGPFPAGNVAKWDGTAWRALGSLLSPGDMAAFDDGGMVLAATHGTPLPNRVSKWDGLSWSELGSGMNSAVYALAGFDPDGAGPSRTRLYAGGIFTGDVAVWGCPAPCYPDCDDGGGLTVADFTCFQTRFVAGEPYADCDASGVLTIADLGCFQNKFVLGCP